MRKLLGLIALVCIRVIAYQICRRFHFGPVCHHPEWAHRLKRPPYSQSNIFLEHMRCSKADRSHTTKSSSKADSRFKREKKCCPDKMDRIPTRFQETQLEWCFTSSQTCVHSGLPLEKGDEPGRVIKESLKRKGRFNDLVSMKFYKLDWSVPYLCTMCGLYRRPCGCSSQQGNGSWTNDTSQNNQDS
jgi:hypothetical protein